jgi:dienelactone hydrolase
MNPNKAHLSLVVLVSLFAATFAIAADPADSIFNYDRSAPLNVQEIGRETRGTALVRDITFTPAGKPVKAYLVSPANRTGPHAAILYAHWLGEPATTNRTEFLDEAVTLAGRGVVSLLVDAMWADYRWYNKDRIPEEDFDHSIRQVIELRRALDLLLAQPDIDAARVAFVGHDFGAMYGTLALAGDRRVKTAVLLAGVPHLIDWMLYQQQPKDLAAYRVRLAPLNPVDYVGRFSPAPVLFQFASKDQYVSATQAATFYAAAGPRKHMATYEAGHDLHTAEVAADRIEWLARELKLQK